MHQGEQLELWRRVCVFSLRFVHQEPQGTVGEVLDIWCFQPCCWWPATPRRTNCRPPCGSSPRRAGAAGRAGGSERVLALVPVPRVGLLGLEWRVETSPEGSGQTGLNNRREGHSLSSLRDHHPRLLASGGKNQRNPRVQGSPGWRPSRQRTTRCGRGPRLCGEPRLSPDARAWRRRRGESWASLGSAPISTAQGCGRWRTATVRSVEWPKWQNCHENP